MMSQCANKLPSNDQGNDPCAVILEETTKESNGYAHMEFLEADHTEVQPSSITKLDDARARTDNFTPQESKTLLNLVHKYKNVMCSKKNGITQWSKEAAWRKIKTEFNKDLSNGFRTTRGLKLMYKAVKDAMQKKFNLSRANSGLAEPLAPLESAVTQMISPSPDDDDLDDSGAMIVDDSTNESSSFTYNEFVETHDSEDDAVEMQSSTPRKNQIRIRGNNFTPEESEKLVDLIIKHKDTVESKENDARQCKLKEKVWHKIETEFNDCVLESFRTNNALKMKYTSIKSILRKKCCLLNADPLNAQPLDHLEIRVNEMLQSEIPDKAPDIDLDSHTDESTNGSSSFTHTEFVDTQESGEDEIESQYATRKRCLNYSIEESEKLIELVDKYIDTIENKKNDGRQWKLKDAAWKNIKTEFNESFSNSFRTSKMLRSKYESLKKNVRMKCSLLRSDPAKTKPLDPLELKVRRMMCEFSDGPLDNDLYVDAGMLCDSTNESSSNSQIELNGTREDDTETQLAARKRCINYTAEESKKLIDLVLKYEDTVESKKNDIRQWKLKDLAWEKIKTEFNDTFPNSLRSSKMLRSKYETIKKGVRLKCGLLRTDSTKAKPLDPVELKMKRIINKSEGVLDDELDSEAAKIREVYESTIEFIDPQKFDIDEFDAEMRSAARTVIDPTLNSKIFIKEELLDLQPTLDNPNIAQPQKTSSRELRRERDVLDIQLELLTRQKRILEEEYAEKIKEWKFREEERNEKRKQWEFLEHERQAKRKEWEFKEYETAEKKKEMESKEHKRRCKEGMNVSTLMHNGHSYE